MLILPSSQQVRTSPVKVPSLDCFSIAHNTCTPSAQYRLHKRLTSLFVWRWIKGMCREEQAIGLSSFLQLHIVYDGLRAHHTYKKITQPSPSYLLSTAQILLVHMNLQHRYYLSRRIIFTGDFFIFWVGPLLFFTNPDR